MAGNSKIGGLGEVALRVNDLDASQTFYAEKIGLELMRRFPTSAFFKIADGFAGHTVILALFDRSARVGQGKTTLAKIIVGELDYGGSLKIGHNVQIGYFAQNQAEYLDGNKTILDTMIDAANESNRSRCI